MQKVHKTKDKRKRKKEKKKKKKESDRKIQRPCQVRD